MQHSNRFSVVAALLVAFSVACGSSSGSTAKPLPPAQDGWWRGRTFYEVFVRSFADSDGDGVGDLRGLTAHLDSLNDGDPATATDLGVGAVWLMPVFPSPSYHGYDVTDYRSVNPRYGTLEDFDAFVKAAHARGIKVILDMVLNHSSSQHPWFVSARQDAAGKRDWYVWRADDPGWTQPFGSGRVWHPWNGAYYYGVFWSGMPDLNLANQAVEDELVATMKLWLSRGVDGFRLDAVRYFFESPAGALADQPETHAFLRRVRTALSSDYPEVLLVAEAWASTEVVATYYGAGDEVQLAFSFDLADALGSSVRTGNAADVVNALFRAEDSLAGKDRGFQAPFLSNHDQVRVMRQLGGDAAAARVAAATLFALPGTPFLYYGEEIGMQGGAGTADENKRTPLRWTADAPGYGFTTAATSWLTFAADEAPGVDVASQQADPASLWHLYRRLVSLRNAHPVLAEGDVALPAVTGGGTGLVALVRAVAGERVLFLANLATTDTGAFTVAAPGTPGALEEEGLAAAPTSDGSVLSVPGLAPRGFAFVSLH